MGKYAIEVENVGMKFNMSSEKVDDLKDYIIKLIKRQLIYKEFWALKDISFIENGVNIHFLELLNFSKIEDLTPLKQLKNLRHLRIDCNKVVDFSFLRDLTNLETLYISSKMGAFEFDYFLGLTLLKKVNISGNSKIQTFNRELQKKMNLD